MNRAIAVVTLSDVIVADVAFATADAVGAAVEGVIWSVDDADNVSLLNNSSRCTSGYSNRPVVANPAPLALNFFQRCCCWPATLLHAAQVLRRPAHI